MYVSIITYFYFSCDHIFIYLFEIRMTFVVFIPKILDRIEKENIKKLQVI